MEPFSHLVNKVRPAGALAEAVSALLSGECEPPITFQCGGETQAQFLARAQHSSSITTPGQHEVIWSDPATGLSCRLVLRYFADSEAVDWVVYFTNHGKSASPILTEVACLDLEWECKGEGFLYRSPGSTVSPEDFQFQRVPLQNISEQRASLYMNAGTQGRPSVAWLPFLNLHTGEDGLIVALGWTGQWFARIDRDGEKVSLSAGMENLRVALQPGESIRGPRVLLLHWRGTPIDGQNALRRLLRQHYLPRFDGKPVEAPICYGAWGGSPTSVHLSQLERIREKNLSYDCYWVDAGWYGTSDKPCPDVFQGEWWRTGDWRVNRNYHPDGLKPIADRAHALGLDFLLWVEPERALHGTPITLEHPEWFLQREPGEVRQEGENLLLNLGLPAAREWATDLISGLIEEIGLDWYRQDFNIEPLPYWRAADESADRQGITEIRYIEGLYAFWDELRRRHPRLRIDNCASGGRRIDLEMLSRSIPLWRNDYNCFPNTDPEVFQVHGLGLSHWIPQHATSPCNVQPGDTYRCRSVLAPGLVFSIEEFAINRVDLEHYPWEWHRRMLEEARRCRPFWAGDIYPLTSCSTAPDAWIAVQLHRADLDAGVVIVFRRAASPITNATFPLKGLRSEVDYTFEDADRSQSWVVNGQDLIMTGLRVAISRPRTSRMIFYSSIRAKERGR
jgi:alpha-galactosidase